MGTGTLHDLNRGSQTDPGSDRSAAGVDASRREGSRAARRVGINAASLLAGDVVNRGATFVIYALVASFGGTLAFGQLSLGLMLLYTFQVFASAGLPTLIVRDVSKRPKLDARYLVHACAIVTLGSVLCYAVLWLFVVASRYAADTSAVVMLLGLSVFPWSLSLVVEAYFRAQERMHLILWAAIPVHLAKLGLAYVLLVRGYGVSAVALVLLAAHVSVFLIQLAILLPSLQSPLPRLDWRICGWMVSRCWQFCGIDVLVALWASINVVLLSWYRGEAAVGVFGAAVQLLIPPGIALRAVVNSLFPVMCRRAEQNPQRSRALVVMIFEVLTFIALPGCVLLWFCAEPLIALIYRDQGFVGSAMLVRIMLLSLVCNAMTALLGQLLMSYGREHVNLRIVTADVVFNVVCGVICIRGFGVTGAATTVLLTSLVNLGLHVVTTRSLLMDRPKSTGPRFLIFWRTLASTAAMAAVLMGMGEVHFAWGLSAAIVTFLVVFGVSCYLSKGGNLALRERFLIPLSES